MRDLTDKELQDLELDRQRTEGGAEFEAEKQKHLSQLVTPPVRKALTDWMKLDADFLDADPELQAAIKAREEESRKTLMERAAEKARPIPSAEETLRAYTFKIWINLVAKCNDKGHRQYRDWGATGVKLHDEWAKSFDAFIRDVGEIPSPRYELRRINPQDNPHFEPDNVMWRERGTTDRWREEGRKHPGGRPKKGQQALLEYEGELLTMPELSKRTGVKLSTIQSRYTAGKSIEQIVNPVRANARGEAWNVVLPGASGDSSVPAVISLIDLCRAKGASYSTVKARLRSGVPLAQALQPKKPKQTHEERKQKQLAAYYAKKAKRELEGK